MGAEEHSQEEVVMSIKDMFYVDTVGDTPDA